MSDRAQVSPLEELNAIRTIVFSPPIGSRLLLNEDTRLTLAAHLNTLQAVIDSLLVEAEQQRSFKHDANKRVEQAVAYVDDHYGDIPNEQRVALRQILGAP